MDITECIAFATAKHDGQTRKNGEIYINHPCRVAVYLKEKGFDLEYQVTGLFHDLLEDTDATENEILKLSNEKVLTAVKLLTKTQDMSKKEYITNILNNPIAKAVKNADRIDNLTDAMDQGVDFMTRYVKNTEQYYYGKFSYELDRKCLALKKRLLDKTSYDYIIDRTFSFPEERPLYRKNKLGEAWKFNYSTKEWDSCDPNFWLELGDDAYTLFEDEVKEIINGLD